MIAALLLALTWDALPPGTGVDRIEATAWVRVPVRIACTDPETGALGVCLAGYVEAWRQTMTVGGTATGLTWTVPDFPSGSVAYIPIEARTGRTIDDGAVCWSGGEVSR